MKRIENENGYIDYYRIDPQDEGFEHLDGNMIDLLYIHEEKRGQGFGRELLKKAKEASRGKMLYLVACPKENNISLSELIDFYVSEGFDVEDAEMPYPLMGVQC